MIHSTAARQPVSSTVDAARKSPLPALQQRPSFRRSDDVVDGSAVSKIYDLKNPTHVVMKARNEQLAASTGGLLRSLKDSTSISGSCFFHFAGAGGQRGWMLGTSKNHTVRFDPAGKNSVTIKNGAISSVHGNMSPMTLNSNLSFFAAALAAPDAAGNLRKNG